MVACAGRGEVGWLEEEGTGGGPILDARRDRVGDRFRDAEPTDESLSTRGDGGTLFKSGDMLRSVVIVKQDSAHCWFRVNGIDGCLDRRAVLSKGYVARPGSRRDSE